MTILQPQQASTGIVKEGQEFYRINQPAVNNGDIFKLDQSVNAVVVGPESDFSEYTLYYYDPLKDLRVNLASVTVDQPWIGRLDARLTDLYPGTDCPGSLYITPKNLYIPQQFQPGSIIVSPNIDIIAYAGDPAQIPDKRPKRRFSLQVPIPNVIYLPVYDRKGWSLRCISGTQGDFGGTLTKLSARFGGQKFIFPIESSAFLAESIGEEIDFLPGNVIYKDAGVTFNAEDPYPWGPSSEPVAPFISATGARGKYDFLCITINSNLNIEPSDANGFGGFQILLEAFD